MKERYLVIMICISLCPIASAIAQQGGQFMGGPSSIRHLTPAQQADWSKSVQLQLTSETLLNSGQFSSAESVARQSLSLNPSEILAQQVLASAQVAQGKTSEAMRFYASRYDGGSSSVREMLPYALLLLRSGQWKAAVDVYNRILPGVGSLLYNGHDLLVADGGYAYDDPQPKDLETDIHIAMGFSGMEDYGRSGPKCREWSLAEYKKALTLRPDSALANLAYAGGLRDLGQHRAANAAFQDVVNKYTGDAKIAAEEELGIYHPDPRASGTVTAR
jgi:tetratricopeptide (TPR) repeat protein